MTMKKAKACALILFIIYLVAVAYCCFGHFSDLPDVGNDTLFGIPMDKVVHFIMFFPFPLLCHLAFFQRGRKLSGVLFSILMIFLIGCMIAAGTEIGQSFTEYRSCDALDFAADCMSLAISSIITLAIELHMTKRLKNICSKES